MSLLLVQTSMKREGEQLESRHCEPARDRGLRRCRLFVVLPPGGEMDLVEGAQRQPQALIRSGRAGPGQWDNHSHNGTANDLRIRGKNEPGVSGRTVAKMGRSPGGNAGSLAAKMQVRAAATPFSKPAP